LSLVTDIQHLHVRDMLTQFTKLSADCHGNNHSWYSTVL